MGLEPDTTLFCFVLFCFVFGLVLHSSITKTCILFGIKGTVKRL